MDRPRRAYRSDLRDGQARATRRAVVAAAHALFLERGYQGTTIDAVAERAGVSRKTVFGAGGKATLLKLALDWALVGDDEPVPMAARPEVAAMRQLTDPVELVGAWASFVTPIAARVGGLHRVMISAAAVDDEIAELLRVSEEQRRGGALGFVGGLASIGGLRDGLDPGHAADVCAVLMDPMPYERLVLGSGWTMEEYAAWVHAVVVATILPPAG